MTGTITSRGATVPAEPDGFGRLLHAEWTKFRTVRDWVIGIIVAGLLIITVNLIPGGECGGQQPGGQVTLGGPGCALTLGPGGEAVTDSFYFVQQPMASTGSITVRVTSMTGSYSPGGAPSQELKSALDRKSTRLNSSHANISYAV